MNVGLFRGAMAMSAGQRHLESIASNLANVQTIGFKRSNTAYREFAIRDSRGERRGLTIPSTTDYTQGDIRRTGRPLDLALLGEGFFAVEGPRGEMYTRDGTFALNPDGVLVTSGEGLPVAWENINVPLDPTGGPIVIAADGGVRQGVVEVGHLKIVNFAQPARLEQNGEGFFTRTRRQREATPTATVHQGALEGSNASGVDELVAMIGVQRNFDAVAQVVSSISDSYQRLTRQ